MHSPILAPLPPQAGASPATPPPAAMAPCRGAPRRGFRPQPVLGVIIPVHIRVLAGVALLLISGCGGERPPAADARATARVAPSATPAADPPAPTSSPPPAARLFAAGAPLDEGALIQAVLARNPSLAAMQATWRAARARYPQETALPDPILDLSLAPFSLHESPIGEEVMLTQTIPWQGKRHGHGDAALAAADVAGEDVAQMRLELRAQTMASFAAYWQAEQALASNRATMQAVSQLAQAQRHAYAADATTRTEVLSTQLMLHELEHHAILLDHACAIAVAHLDFLLHLPSDQPLPPPPLPLEPLASWPALRVLVAYAHDHRPDVAAAAARLRQARALAGVADDQDLPDLQVSVGYSTMWSDPDMRMTVGVGIPLPVQRGQRAAARAEARDEIDRAQDDQLALADRVDFEVREADEHLRESWHVLHLLRSRMVPTAEQMVDAANAGVAAGGAAFSAAVDAQKQLIEIRWREQAARAEFHERLAALERAIGGPLPPVPPTLEHHP